MTHQCCSCYLQVSAFALRIVLMPAGLIGCFLLCIILGACEAFTMYVLSKFAERYQAPTYSGLIRKALGRKLSASERNSCFTCRKALSCNVMHAVLVPLTQSDRATPLRVHQVGMLHGL